LLDDPATLAAQFEERAKQPDFLAIESEKGVDFRQAYAKAYAPPSGGVSVQQTAYSPVSAQSLGRVSKTGAAVARCRRTDARNAAVGSRPAGEPNRKRTPARLWGGRELVAQPPALGEPGKSNDHSDGQHGSRRAGRLATDTARFQTPSL
jgi:hypothetical protein